MSSLSRSPSHGSNKNSQSREQSASRQSGRVTFPTPRTGSSKPKTLLAVIADSPEDSSRNPFSVPADNDIFMLRDKERQRKKQERIKQRTMKVHEKTTYSSQVNAKTAAMRKIGEDSDEDEKEEKKDKDGTIAVKDDPQFTLAVTKDRHVEKENLNDFIAKKREMFLVQYSLGVKRDEMRKLEEIAQAEEKKLELAEQYLEEDAAMFDEFLKENDKNSVEAIKIAEAETKLKLEKVGEIKKINAQMMAIKSEISKNEDALKEYMLYKQFLDSLTPQEWRDAKRKKREETRKQKQKEKTLPRKKVSLNRVASRSGRTQSRSSQKHGGLGTPQTQKISKGDAETESQTSSQSTYESEEEDSDEEPELFFSDPQQLLDIFAELEEQNLSLIQNSQETEEALEEMKQTIKQTQERMNRETEILKSQIDFLEDAIKKENERAADLEMKSKMFSYGEFKAEDQEKMLAALNKKVEEVYRNCIGDNEANISTLQMLTNIENRLEELFESIEIMPPERVEMAEKAKEKERRMRLREEKMEQQRIHQEDRVRRALERAQAEPKKKTGKPLMFRSEPPQTRKKEQDGDKKQDKEEEELKYFFS